MIRINNNYKDTITEFKGQIIDIFENYCDEEKIMIVNDEESESDAAIVGETYDAIANEIEKIVNKHYLATMTVDPFMGTVIACAIVDIFRRHVETGHVVLNGISVDGVYVPTYDITQMVNKVVDTLRNWGVLTE